MTCVKRAVDHQIARMFGYTGIRMLITSATPLLIISAIIAVVGVIGFTHYGGPWQAWVNVFCGFTSIVLLSIFGPPGHALSRGRREPDDMSDLSEQRRRELVRGTSMYL